MFHSLQTDWIRQMAYFSSPTSRCASVKKCNRCSPGWDMEGTGANPGRVIVMVGFSEAFNLVDPYIRKASIFIEYDYNLRERSLSQSKAMVFTKIHKLMAPPFGRSRQLMPSSGLPWSSSSLEQKFAPLISSWSEKWRTNTRNGCQPKNRGGKPPKSSHLFIGFSMKFSPSILGGKLPLFLVQHPNQGEILSSPKFWSGRIWVEYFDGRLPWCHCKWICPWKSMSYCSIVKNGISSPLSKKIAHHFPAAIWRSLVWAYWGRNAPFSSGRSDLLDGWSPLFCWISHKKFIG